MANPIALAVGLSRLIEITCHCHRRFAEPPRRRR
jgi:hypothetical protein